MDENRIIKVQFLEVIIVFHPNLTTLILFSSRYGAHLRPEVMMMKEKWIIMGWAPSLGYHSLPIMTMKQRLEGSSSFISFHHTISSLGSGSRLLLYVSRRSPVRRIYIMSTNILSSFVSLLTPSSIRFHSGRLWLTLFHRQKGTERTVSLPSLSIINSGHMEPRAQHEGDGTTVEAWKLYHSLRTRWNSGDPTNHEI